jgi:hypothetical protein
VGTSVEERSHIWEVGGPRREHCLRVTNNDTSKYGPDPGGLWAIAERDGNPYNGPCDPMAWRRAIEADFPADGDVMCDPSTFMPNDEWLDVSLGVIGFAPDLAEKALVRASSRMMLVTVEGKECVTFDELEELVMEDDEAADSASYISDPERLGDFVGLSNIDTHGERYTWMFRTYLRIVAEELRAMGAVPAKIVPFPSNSRD